MSTVLTTDPQFQSAIQACAAALHRMADYELDPSLQRRIHELGERKEFLTRVAQQLGLCRQRLRKHCRGKASPASVSSLPAALPFVEVYPAWRVPTAEIEVQRPDGQRLRLSLYETSPALAPLLRTFAEHRCCSNSRPRLVSFWPYSPSISARG